MNDAVTCQAISTIYLSAVFLLLLAARKGRFLYAHVPDLRQTPPQPWLISCVCALAREEDPRPPDAFSSHAGGATRKPRAKTRWPVAGDWLAPLIVWGLMIALGMAIASLLLGEK